MIKEKGGGDEEKKEEGRFRFGFGFELCCTTTTTRRRESVFIAYLVIVQAGGRIDIDRGVFPLPHLERAAQLGRRWNLCDLDAH